MLAWGALGGAYIKVADYQNAKRIFEERINETERLHGPDQVQTAGYLALLASTHLREGKHDLAIAEFRRSLQIEAKLGQAKTRVNEPSNAGLAEALLAKDQAADAVRLLTSARAESKFQLTGGVLLMHSQSH